MGATKIDGAPGTWGDVETVLLEAADAAAASIRLTPFNPDDAVSKDSYDGTVGGDIAMPADDAAQSVYEEARERQLPWAGMLAEERLVRVLCSLPGYEGSWHAYVTADGLDGTKRYRSGAKSGISTMVAFVYGGEVRFAAVHDVYRDEVFWLSANDGHVWWVDATGRQRVDISVAPRAGTLAQMPFLTRGDRTTYHPLIERLVGLLPGEDCNHFEKHTSIGLSMAELWFDDAGIHIQAPGFWTPWDDTPTIGIGLALGMVWLRPSEDGLALEEFVPPLVHEVTRRPECLVIIHRSRLDELDTLVPVRRLS